MRFFLTVLALALFASSIARAECGTDRLGTARVVEVGTQGGLLVGLKTYDKTITLGDHEVILTFDDGPDAHYTPEVLRAPADQSAPPTLFVIGGKVRAPS